ncbi:uncharacterized protein LOC143279453 [Babylonia areolata]|uniref:uncharacterized protein LOC143279453 n=1 Tax=Babylonia areolata TaxID=304850 RepID=UPI003FD40090
MVLQGTKRSLRTGNTLRNTGNRLTNRHPFSVIIRHVTNTTGRQLHDDADDSYLTADTVEFSLNKKGRWNLPEVIEDNIKLSEPGDASVALLHRHRRNRQNDCLRVVTNAALPGADHQSPYDAGFQRKKAHRKQYCNGLNVVHNGRGKSRKERRTKQVVSTKKDLQSRKQQRQELDTVPEDTYTSAVPAVRYDVFYSVPSTSSLRFNPKFCAASGTTSHPADSQRQNVTVTTYVKRSKGSHQRSKQVHYDAFEDDDYYDDWLYDEDNYYEEDYSLYAEEEYDHDDPHANATSEVSFKYSDFLEQAFEEATVGSTTIAVKRPVKRKQLHTKPRKKRGGLFYYTPDTVNQYDSCLEDSQSETSSESGSTFSVSSLSDMTKVTQMPSVSVELCQEATRPQQLADWYGEGYIEAACTPRKIVIEITDRVHTAVSHLTAFRDVFLPSLDLTTYVVLTYVHPAGQDQEPQDTSENHHDRSLGPCSTNVGQYDVFRVQLNMNCTTQGLALYLHGKMRFESVEDLLQHVLHFVTTLTPESLTRRPVEASASALKSRLATDFSTVAEVNGWKASCVSLLGEQVTDTLPEVPCGSTAQLQNVDQNEEDPCFPSDFTNRPTESQTPDTSAEKHQVPVHTLGEMYCHICFGEIVPGTSQGPHGTALASCQHWFCDTCWQSHVTVAMQEKGSRNLQCPEFGCEEEVDLGTLLSLQNVHDVILQQRRLVEVKVMRLFLCKWCPNPHCGRVVKLAASPSQVLDEPTSMSCPCGQQFCFRCHGDPHWPLSCEDQADYHALLRKNGYWTREDTLVTVRGKPCPSCRLFIERVGGCPYMTCPCGFTFWWCCSKHTSKSHDCPRFLTVTDLTNTKLMKIRHTTAPRPQFQSEWYEMAVKHRNFQGPREVKMDCRRAEQLYRKLQSLSAKGVDVGAFPTPPEDRSAAQAELPTPLKPGCTERVTLSGPGQLYPCRSVAEDKGRKVVVKSGSVSESANSEHTWQRIKQTTLAMVKQKVELHNVLENVAAFLHLRQSAQGCHSKVKENVDLLQFFLTCLDDLLRKEGHRELPRVLPWFRRLQRPIKDTLTTLAGHMDR